MKNMLILTYILHMVKCNVTSASFTLSSYHFFLCWLYSLFVCSYLELMCCLFSSVFVISCVEFSFLFLSFIYSVPGCAGNPFCLCSLSSSQYFYCHLVCNPRRVFSLFSNFSFRRCQYFLSHIEVFGFTILYLFVIQVIFDNLLYCYITNFSFPHLRFV